MMSPGFHSAAFLVHLSGFGVAIRRASRPLQFPLCFNPICDVVCQHLFIGFFRDSLIRVQSSLLDCLLGLLCCHHHHHRMKYCCLGRIHHVCCLLRESPRLFHRHECSLLGGSGMKDVSAWQMLRRWDGLNELSSGKNEGVKTPRKKKE